MSLSRFIAFNACVLTLAAHAYTAPRPNIIHIIVDDMGYSDLGCTGSEIRTPHLDRLANEGILFTHFYNAGKCEVTRASLMSGRWWMDTGIGVKKGPTIGQELQAADYRTYAVGKWHLDGNPVDRGFDRFFGHLSGASDYFVGNKTWRLDHSPFTAFSEEFYATDANTDYTIEFIEEGRQEEPEKPFYVYLAYNAPHNPLQVPEEDFEKYRGRYLAGWDSIRESRFKKQKQLGIVPPHAALPERPLNLPNWEGLSDEQKDLEDQRMAIYASMVERIDHNVGRLVNYLSESGQLENTLLLFHSDNGANPFSRTDAAMLNMGKRPGDRDSNWEPGNGWAYACVTPFRMYKRHQHEGGIRSPLIAWWPKMNEGKRIINDTPLHIVDILPTLTELAGSQKESDSRPGKSMAPLFSKSPYQPHKYIYFQLMDHRALRFGEWKLSAHDSGPWELYNLAEDPTESKNLFSSNRALAKSLAKEWNAWWGQYNNEPYSPRRTPEELRVGDDKNGVPYLPFPRKSVSSQN
ncbi:arylsulfatase [Pelagicoccus sp. NFK12]|uniref:Arylsulfatase n=1 Tax=Pelagicoccus enzymogenes TaxID=2773457 RepID=A0A927IJK3_9BACT|nr:arylsulfatase [Pelagicoccus enzymogenes]MBD5781635.1 arylsulfatase [Pelagicoccus enzymogenes]